MNKPALANELTETFIEYQWRLDNPFPSPEQTKENMYLKYRSDSMFHAKVDSLVFGVMFIVERNI